MDEQNEHNDDDDSSYIVVLAFKKYFVYDLAMEIMLDSLIYG